VPLIFGLTGSEEKVLSLLGARDVASKQQIMTVLMVDRGGDEEPEIKIVDVFVCKIRKKLKPFGVAIDTVWARGYRLTPENKKKVAEYLATEGREEDAA
jgi:two-component system cell cycle response regulator CtrA